MRATKTRQWNTDTTHFASYHSCFDRLIRVKKCNEVFNQVRVVHQHNRHSLVQLKSKSSNEVQGFISCRFSITLWWERDVWFLRHFSPMPPDVTLPPTGNETDASQTTWRLCVFVCLFVCVCVCCMCKCVRACVHVHVCVLVCMFVFVFVCECLCVCLCVRACVRMCVMLYWWGPTLCKDNTKIH